MMAMMRMIPATNQMGLSPRMADFFTERRLKGFMAICGGSCESFRDRTRHLRTGISMENFAWWDQP